MILEIRIYLVQTWGLKNWAIKNPPNSSFLISEYPILRLKQIELFGMVPSTHKRAPGQILPSSQRPRTGQTVGGSPFGWRLVDENPTNQGVFGGNQQFIRDLRYSVIGILIGIVVDIYIYIPSGKHTKNYGKSPCYSWEISRTKYGGSFHSYVTVITRGYIPSRNHQIFLGFLFH